MEAIDDERLGSGSDSDAARSLRGGRAGTGFDLGNCGEGFGEPVEVVPEI